MKANNPLNLQAERREYDDTQANVFVNNGGGAIVLSLAYLPLTIPVGDSTTNAVLNPEMARTLAQDLIERADELDPPTKLTFRVSTSRDATSEEVSNLLYGTGSLSWGWWGGCDAEKRNGVAGYLFTHDTEEDNEGAMSGRTWVSEQQILDAAARAVMEGRAGEDQNDIVGEDIGYFDASQGDVVLQYAVFGKAVFG